MKIRERISRLKELAHNPAQTPYSIFEAYWMESVRLWDRRISIDHRELPPLPEETIKCFLSDYKDEQNIVLYSGGKESFLTRKILEANGIKPTLLWIEEAGNRRKSQYEKDCMVKAPAEADLILQSTFLEHHVNNNQYGRHVPILYYYALRALDRFPGANVWLGVEYEPLWWLMTSMEVAHSDVMLHDLTRDPDVNGRAFSIVNSLREFDIFRLCYSKLGYDPATSYADNADKRERIELFKKYADFMACLGKSKERSYILAEIPGIQPHYTFNRPLIYDWRYDVEKYIGGLLK